MDPCPRCGDPYAPLGRADDGRPLRYHCNTCGWVRIPDPVTRKLHDAPMDWQPPWIHSSRIRRVFTAAANEMGRPLDPAERRLTATFARTDELIARVQERPWWAFWRAHRQVGHVHDECTNATSGAIHTLLPGTTLPRPPDS